MRRIDSVLVVCVTAIIVFLGAWGPQQAYAANETDPILGTWTGSYIGYDRSGQVERTIKMEVDKHSGSTFSGRITITSEKACWYTFEGTLDDKTGACSFEGSEWLQNSAGYDFAHFEGKLGSGTLKGTVDDDSARTFKLKRTTTKVAAHKSGSKLNYVWTGEYDGASGYTVVRRDYVIRITSCSRITGALKGKAYIKPSKKANKYYGVNGSYRFSGTYDWNTGFMSMQGYSWIQYPVGDDSLDSFDFVSLKGFVDKTGTKISGMSDNGIWQMSSTSENKLFGNVKTTQTYRYPKAYKKTRAAYPALANLTNVATYGMPGLERSSSMTGSTKNMVPQGICIAKDYILVTAYCASEDYCSAIYVLSKKTGKLLKTLETSDANHVGGIAFDGKRVYVARSTNNQVGVIDYSTIKSAVKKSGNVAAVYYEKTIDLWQTASFVTYAKGKLWVGYCAPAKSSANSSYLTGYKVSGSNAETTEIDTYNTVTIEGLPNCANGADFATVDGEVRLVVNVSPGRAKDSTRYVYKVNVKSGSKSLLFKQMMPPMMEESCVSGDYTYTIFESAATKYSTWASGAPCKYIVDRICVGKTSQLFTATNGTYVSLGATSNAASYLIKNSKKLTYCAPSPFNTSKSLTIPAVGTIGEVDRSVTGISPNAFAYASKTKTLTIGTQSLTASSVRNSLKGSKVSTVTVPSEKLKTYKQAFAKSNSGKKVKVKASSSLKTSAVEPKSVAQAASPLAAASW